MQIVWLILIALLAYIAGMAIVYALTGNMRHVIRYQALAVVAALAALWLAFAHFAGWMLVLALLLIPVMLAIGYLLRARAFLHSEDTRDLPPLTRKPGDAHSGFTAVIYLAHGEPEQYDPTGLINAYREAGSAGLPVGPLWARPIAVAQLRRQYKGGARSDHRHIHRRTLKLLESAEAAAGVGPERFYLAFLDDEPRPEAAVIQALNEGAAAIVVLEVYAVDTPHSAAGKQRIADVVAGVADAPPLLFTGPLADSPALQKLFALRAEARTPAAERSAAGFLLVALARSTTWARLLPASAAAEERLLAAAQAALNDAGFNLVRVARLHGSPAPMNMAEELAEAGAQTIYYALITESADSQLSHNTLPADLAHVVVEDGVNLVNLGGWNDDPQLVKALQEALRAVRPAAPAAT